MMKSTLVFLVTLISAVQIALAEENKNIPLEKKQWEGRYAFKEVEGNNFFEAFSLDNRLQEILPEELHHVLELYKVTSTIKEESDWLIYWGCEPHQCENQILMAIDMNSKNIAVSISTGKDPLRIYVTQLPGYKSIPQCVTRALMNVPAKFECKN